MVILWYMNCTFEVQLTNVNNMKKVFKTLLRGTFPRLWKLKTLNTDSHGTLLFLDSYFHTSSRQAGHRFGEHLERIIPLIVKYAKVDGDDELREYCIQVRFDKWNQNNTHLHFFGSPWWDPFISKISSVEQMCSWPIWTVGKTWMESSRGWKLIVRGFVVLRNTVVGYWGFDGLSGGHFQKRFTY